MSKHYLKVLILAVSIPAAGAHAVDTDAVIGGAVGGGVGAAIGSELGGKQGAIAGSAIGAAIGTAITADESGNRDHKTHVHVDGGHTHPSAGGPPPHAYRTPPGHAKHGKKHKWK